MRELPLVSIVTPVLDGARFLADNLASVRGQDHPRIEHIVVDGGSTDGTQDLLRRAEGVSWTSEPDGGMYDAIGRGLRRARGEIVAYQNADDRYVVPGAVSAVVAYFHDHPEVDVVYGDFRFIAEDGSRLDRRPWRVTPFDLRALLRANFIPPQSTFLRRSAIDQGLLPDATLQYPGDWDWYIRLARAGKVFAHLDRELSEFRLHARSKTRTIGWATKLREWRRVCRRNGTSYAAVLWHGLFLAPLRRRLGLS
jgi:glycosyltransferase involved in cell wall biosynthesis